MTTPPPPLSERFAKTGRVRIVAILSVILFARMLGVFIILPVTVPLVSEMGDVPAWGIGLVLSSYGLTQALMQIPTGMLADRYGRKPVLFFALSLFTIGGFWAAMADDFVGVIIGRFLQGAGAVATVAAAWISDVTDETKQGRAMAMFGASIALAFVVSLFVASPLAAAVKLSGVFYVAGILGLFSLFLLLLLPAPTQQYAKKVPPLFFASPVLLRCAGGGFVLHYAMAAMFFLLPTAIADTLPLADHWQIYASGFVASLFVSLPLLARLDRSPRLVMVVAILLAAIGVGLLILADSLAIAVVSLFFFFGGFVVLEAALPAAAAKAADPKHRAAAMGFVITAEFIGVFLGGGLTGFLYEGGGSIIASSFVCLLFALWLLSFHKKISTKNG